MIATRLLAPLLATSTWLSSGEVSPRTMTSEFSTRQEYRLGASRDPATSRSGLAGEAILSEFDEREGEDDHLGVSSDRSILSTNSQVDRFRPRSILSTSSFPIVSPAPRGPPMVV
ncbi:MAG: hypothetical protein AB7I30_13485 [Isosphaeraceae bacterium]